MWGSIKNSPEATQTQNGQWQKFLGPILAWRRKMEVKPNTCRHFPISITWNGWGRGEDKELLSMLAVHWREIVITQPHAITNFTSNREFLLPCTSHSQFHPSLTEMSNGTKYQNRILKWKQYRRKYSDGKRICQGTKEKCDHSESKRKP